MPYAEHAQVYAPVSTELGLVLLGPPGVGKGTQATLLRDEFDLVHVATGDLLRDHRARGTDLGRQAKEYMSAGQLVPDELVIEMVRERIRVSERFVLDGFPRTLPQAYALTDVLRDEGRQLTAAVLVEAPDDVVVQRIADRRDGRDDDEADTVRSRLEVFHRSTAPVVGYYAELGLLHRIDASRPIADVYADARGLLAHLSTADQLGSLG
jgi:adenylate kinase